ncbi:AsmA family protein [Dongia deserti]|uniref:AsmA family protein n=1 Tax=Dongia deserti TaxID=2268030 RepID=UPI000E652354|nr:AsmA family protein [Dongia deserti]
MPGRRIARTAAITLGALVLLVIAAMTALITYAGSSAFRGEVERRAGVALGREVKLGDLQIDWSWSPRIRMREVMLGGAAKDAPPLLEAQSILVQLRLPPLLRGEVVLPELELEKPELALSIDEKGVPNWSFSKNPTAAAAAEVAAPEERTEAPVIGKLVIKDGHFKYEDQVKDLQLEGAIATAIGEAEKTERIQLDGKGKLEGRPLIVKFDGGSVLALREGDKPYPLDLAAKYSATEVTVKGTALDPFKLEAADLDITLKGPDLADVFPLLGVPAPPTPPYELKGHLLRDGDKWQFTNVEGRVGDSDMAGDITIDYGREKPLLTADLVSDKLDFDDLAPLVGAPPDTDETASAEQKEAAAQLKQQDELFPDIPLNLNLLDVMDMEVKLDAKKVTAENYLPVEALAGTVTIEGGKAVVKPLQIAIAGGSLEGALSLDANHKPSVAAADLAMRNVDFKAFFQGTQYFDTTGGKVGAEVDIEGQGKSLAEVMGTSNGKMFLTMNGGAMSGLLIEAAGLDIAEALALYIGEDARVPIRCAAGEIELTKGVARFDRFIMDTTDSVLYFRGQSNLRQQTIVMDIFADAKDFSILDMDAPVHLEGKIREPAISIGKGVPIPLIEPGDAENISCDLLLEGKL